MKTMYVTDPKVHVFDPSLSDVSPITRQGTDVPDRSIDSVRRRAKSSGVLVSTTPPRKES